MPYSKFKERFAELVARVNQRDHGVVCELERAIEDSSHDTPTRCRLRCLRAFALCRAGDIAQAEEDISALLPFATREKLFDVVTQCHRILAESADSRGDQLANREHCAAALAAAKRCDDFSLRYACEIHIANLIGEWGKAEHAAMVMQRLHERTDWSDPSRAGFLSSTLGLLSWWLTQSGRPEEALRYLKDPACLAPHTPYRRQTLATDIAIARHALGVGLDLDELENMLSRALENDWHSSAAELHWLLSHQAADDSLFAKSNVELALALKDHCSVDVRLIVLKRAITCAMARGDRDAESEYRRMQALQREAIVEAERAAPLVCPLSGELVV